MNRHIQYIFKYLAVYMNASLDIHTALILVQKRLKHKKLESILLRIQSDIHQGKSIKESFTYLKSSAYVDDVVWSILITAEQSGNIAQSFLNISDYIKEYLRMRSSLVGALVYPVGMLCASMSMVYFLITLIFPKIFPLFSSMNVELPLSARFIVYTSHMLSQWGFYVFFMFGLCITSSVYLFFKKDSFRYVVQKVYLTIPYIGNIVKAKEYNSISRTLGILMNNNRTIYESIHTAFQSSQVLPFKYALHTILSSIQQGRSLSDGLSKQKIFENDWIDLVTVGEVTGSLPKTFVDISEVYAEKYKDSINNLIRVSEPLALLCSAFVVLIVALAVIQPMYGLIQHVNNV